MNGPDGHSRAARDRDVPSNRCHQATTDEGSRSATTCMDARMPREHMDVRSGHPPGWWPSKAKGESSQAREELATSGAGPSYKNPHNPSGDAGKVF